MPELRKCKIKNGQIAYFHKWSDKVSITSEGKTIALTVGIIEYEDGTVHECYPDEIRFIDDYCKPKLIIHAYDKIRWGWL